MPVISPPPPPPPPPANVKMMQPRMTIDDEEPRGAEIVEVVEEPTVRPSDVVKGMVRSMSALCKFFIILCTLLSYDIDFSDHINSTVRVKTLTDILILFMKKTNSNVIKFFGQYQAIVFIYGILYSVAINLGIN